MVRFRRNKKEEDYKDDYDEDNLTDDEIETMILLDLLLSTPDCNGCPGDKGCC
ncbi:hypothetical protein LCGC14_0368280 [marine sediment metagenome]|uniref:Uncharacterized protein n=1 Tax=marine sediment metagenome TaxID=412755 RepID=A0A0F9VT31_9ZZZZ